MLGEEKDGKSKDTEEGKSAPIRIKLKLPLNKLEQSTPSPDNCSPRKSSFSKLKEMLSPRFSSSPTKDKDIETEKKHLEPTLEESFKTLLTQIKQFYDPKEIPLYISKLHEIEAKLSPKEHKQQLIELNLLLAYFHELRAKHYYDSIMEDLIGLKDLKYWYAIPGVLNVIYKHNWNKLLVLEAIFAKLYLEFPSIFTGPATDLISKLLGRISISSEEEKTNNSVITDLFSKLLGRIPTSVEKEKTIKSVIYDILLKLKDIQTNLYTSLLELENQLELTTKSLNIKKNQTNTLDNKESLIKDMKNATFLSGAFSDNLSQQYYVKYINAIKDNPEMMDTNEAIDIISKKIQVGWEKSLTLEAFLKNANINGTPNFATTPQLKPKAKESKVEEIEKTEEEDQNKQFKF